MSVDIFDIMVKIQVPATTHRETAKITSKMNVHVAEHYTSI